MGLEGEVEGERVEVNGSGSGSNNVPFVGAHRVSECPRLVRQYARQTAQPTAQFS